MLSSIKKHFAKEWSTTEGKFDILTIGAMLFALVAVSVAGLLVS